MAGTSGSTNRINPDSLRIASVESAGWVSAASQQLEVGQVVRTVSGGATIVRILGRVGDGSRLLELRLEEAGTPPFFAAASNVLVHDPTMVGADDSADE